MNKGYTQYLWRGEPIKDINKWCEENNTHMVKIKNTRKIPCLFSGEIREEVTVSEMPLLMWEQFGWSGSQGIYELIEEE